MCWPRFPGSARPQLQAEPDKGSVLNPCLWRLFSKPTSTLEYNCLCVYGLMGVDRPPTRPKVCPFLLSNRQHLPKSLLAFFFSEGVK